MYQEEIVHPLHNRAYATGLKGVNKGIAKMAKETASCCATKGVAGVECKEVRPVGNANHNARPLILVKGNDPVGLGHITNSGL